MWDMEVYQRHVLLAINVVDGSQRGDAVAEWRTIPDWMLHHNWLEPGHGGFAGCRCPGHADSLGIVAGESCMVWEAAVQLVRQDHSWVYSPDTYLHSLRLKVVADHLRSVEPIASRKLDAWPASAAQVAADGENRAGR